MTEKISTEMDCALIQAAAALTRTYHRNKALTAVEKDISDVECNLEVPSQEFAKRASEARNRHNSLEAILESYSEVLQGLRAKFKDGDFPVE